MARKNNGFGDTEAVRHEIEKIDIYEISQDELNILAGNQTSDLYLEIAIALISIFVSFFCSLLVADFNNHPLASNVFLFLTLISFVGGIIFLILWHRGRKDKITILDRIKCRGTQS